MLLIRKENNRYFLSGGLTWIPLPEKIKSRSDVEKHIRRTDYQYGSQDQKPVNYYEVYWLNRDPKLGTARMNETATKTSFPCNSTKEQIISHLQNHAKQYGMNAEVVFLEEPPESSEMSE